MFIEDEPYAGTVIGGGNGGSDIEIILGIVFGVVFLVLIGGIVIYKLKKKNGQNTAD